MPHVCCCLQKAAAAQPATRAAAAAAAQKGLAIPSSSQPAATASAPLTAAVSAPAALPTSGAPPAGAVPAAAGTGRSGSQDGGTLQRSQPAEGFAFALAANCSTPASFGNSPRLRISGAASQAADQRRLEGGKAIGVFQQSAQHGAGGMGNKPSAPRVVAFSSPGAASSLSPVLTTPGTPLEVSYEPAMSLPYYLDLSLC